MRRSRSRVKQVWQVCLIFLLIALVLFPSSFETPLRLLSSLTVEVVQVPLNIAAFFNQKAMDVWSDVQGLIDLRTDNQKLREEVLRLNLEQNLLKEFEVAVDRYQKLFDFKQRCPYSTIVSEVIGRNPTNWYQSLVITKGEQDGIIPGLGVITPSGVVGRVFKVYRTFSIVQLILDRDSVVTGLVQRTRDEGIIQGSDNGEVIMKYLPPLSLLKTGDVVITSGLDDRFPKGMIVGTVKQIQNKEAGPFKSATLRPYADFSKLEEVIVLLDIVPSNEKSKTCFVLDAAVSETSERFSR